MTDAVDRTTERRVRPHLLYPNPAFEDPIVPISVPFVALRPGPPPEASPARERRESRDAIPSTIPRGIHAPTATRDGRAPTT